MPARKSNASVADDESGLSVEVRTHDAPHRPDSADTTQDLNLPKTMVNRLAKGALPANFNVQAVAQSAISKSATVFVNYLTAHASDIAARQNKKTIQPKDVLDALKELEFEMFVDRTNDELIKYTEIQCTKRNSYRRRVKDEKRAAEDAGGHTSGTGTVGPDGSIISVGPVDEDGAGQSSMAGGQLSNTQPFSKRPRLDLTEDGDQDMDGDEGEDEGDEEGEDEDGQDEDEDEEEDEEGEEGDEGDREDLLEEREDREEGDEAMEGEESD
ncbi:histone-fold-containing protein [Phyllosticta citrichinensis]